MNSQLTDQKSTLFKYAIFLQNNKFQSKLRLISSAFE